MSQDTTSAEFFERKYQQSADPWDFARSEYERSRYEAIVRAMGERRYERAFEPGCSVGELTWRLAERCGRVLATDISATAVARAQQRCRNFSNVQISVGGFPHQMPEGHFDLVVFSELGYYLEETALEESGNMLVRRICTSGTLLAAHWLGTSKDHLLGGDRVHEVLGKLTGLRLEHSERHANFRLDRWIRIGGEKREI